ncbi:unnamed protein product [Phaeothamnion confervicola]
MSYTPTGRPSGRPPKPTAQKRRIGNPGHRPLPPLREPATSTGLRVVGTGELIAPTRPLGTHGRALWDRCVAMPWVEESDLDVLLLTCETADERSQLRMQVLRDGNRFDRAALRQVDRQIGNMLSALGFDPVARSRMGVGEPSEADELAVLRARRSELPRPS